MCFFFLETKNLKFIVVFPIQMEDYRLFKKINFIFLEQFYVHIKI